MRSAAGERRAQPAGISAALGLLVAIAAWQSERHFVTPRSGLDPSWHAGLEMASQRDLAFGTEVVFTYGPLFSLRDEYLWFSTPAVAGFAYDTVLWIALAIGLVWSLGRTLPTWAAALLAWAVLVISPELEAHTVLAVLGCLAALSADSPGWLRRLTIYGGGLLTTVEALISLRSGPVLAAIFLITLAASARPIRDICRYLVTVAVSLPVVWLIAGQPLGGMADYLANGSQIVGGYSEAMGFGGAGIAGSLLIVASVALSAMAWRQGRDRRSSAAGAAVVALIGFSLFKEGFVRADEVHITIAFATLLGVGAVLSYGRARIMATATIVILIALVIALPSVEDRGTDVLPTTNMLNAVSQFRTFASPHRRQRTIDAGRAALIARYRLPPEVLRELRGRRVHVSPWESAVAWTYRLRWSPLPVFQDYAAYTASLDRLNAEQLSSPDGPERVLRENVAAVTMTRGAGQAIDGRFAGWETPLVTRTLLCRFRPIVTTLRWQVLGRGRNRCGPTRRIGVVSVPSGVPVSVPPAGRRQIVEARILGTEVAGAERVRSLLYRARYRLALVNGISPVRLVPGLVENGLLMSATPAIDFGRPPFTLSPAARTIAVRQPGSRVRIEFTRTALRD